MQKPSTKIMNLIVKAEIFKTRLNIFALPCAILSAGLIYNGLFSPNLHTWGGVVLSMIIGVIGSLWIRKIAAGVYYGYLAGSIYGNDQQAFLKDSLHAKDYFEYQARKLKPDGSNLTEIVDTIMKETEELDEVEESEYSGPVELTIVDTSKSVGTYLDAKIYDWIDIAGGVPGEKVRLNFFTTIDISKSTDIDADCILILPGIVYKLARISGE